MEAACFDAMVYRDRNQDLSPTLTDAQLKEHWLNYGIKQGRASSTILDLGFYLANNPDLQSSSDRSRPGNGEAPPLPGRIFLIKDVFAILGCFPEIRERNSVKRSVCQIFFLPVHNGKRSCGLYISMLSGIYSALQKPNKKQYFQENPKKRWKNAESCDILVENFEEGYPMIKVLFVCHGKI